MDTHGRSFDGAPVFDSLDIDLVIKVLAHTVLSPFFVFFIPVFYVFLGAKLNDPIVVTGAAYFVVICLFWAFKWFSLLYRNQGSLLFAPPRLDWGDQIVVVTGGSSGLGELLASTLAVRNVSVVVLDVKPIETDNYNITYYKCDVSKWEEVEAVSKQVIEEIGQPTMLINNAGVAQGKKILDLSPDDIKQTFGVNTLAHFWTIKAFLPGMIKQKKGHIVTVSSILGWAGVAQMSDYCASKAALLSLHESLRYELDKKYQCPQIRTTLVLPGHILTPLFRHVNFTQNPIRKFFLPSVAPVDVVKKIIISLDNQHSQVITLPFYGHFMSCLHVLPSFLRDFCQWITGADEAMDKFVKISGRREEEGPAPKVNGSKHD